MALVVDDLSAWLVALLADAGRKKLTSWVLGTEQQRALHQAAQAAVERTAEELVPASGERAEQLAMVVGEVFREPAPDAPVAGLATWLSWMTWTSPAPGSRRLGCWACRAQSWRAR